MSGVSEFRRKRREGIKRQKVENYLLMTLFSEYTEKGDRVYIREMYVIARIKFCLGYRSETELRRKEIKWTGLVRISVMEVRNSLGGMLQFHSW